MMKLETINWQIRRFNIPEEPTDQEKSQQKTKYQPIKSHTEETKCLVYQSYIVTL